MGKYSGKYTARRRAVHPVFWVLVLLVLLSLSTGGVAAYLAASTGSVENTFKMETSVDPSITETFADNVKSNVSVNVGDPGYSVYVRAAILVNWKNGKNGDVLAVAPEEGVDYEMSLNLAPLKDENYCYWVKNGDFYYYFGPEMSESDPTQVEGYELIAVESGSTSNLIKSCKLRQDAPVDGYTLNVEIIAQTIQALGTTDADSIPAVQDAWSITVNPAA